jgi:hypothetical protein
MFAKHFYVNMYKHLLPDIHVYNEDVTHFTQKCHEKLKRSAISGGFVLGWGGWGWGCFVF